MCTNIFRFNYGIIKYTDVPDENKVKSKSKNCCKLIFLFEFATTSKVGGFVPLLAGGSIKLDVQLWECCNKDLR